MQTFFLWTPLIFLKNFPVTSTWSAMMGKREGRCLFQEEKCSAPFTLQSIVWWLQPDSSPTVGLAGATVGI